MTELFDNLAPYFERIYTTLTDDAPRVAGGFLILLAGWVAAKLVQKACFAGFRKLGVDRAISGKDDTAASKTASQIVYLLVMLFTLLLFFDFVNLQVVAGPLETLFNKMFGAFSHVLGALAMAALAYIVARLARAFVAGGGRKLGFDRLFERLGIRTEEGRKTPTEWAGDLSFFVVILMFLPAILNYLRIEALTGPVSHLVDRFLDFAVRLAGSLLILVLAWLVATFVRPLVSSLLAALNVDQLARSAGLKAEGKGRPSQWIGDVVFVLVILFFLPAALANLSLPTLAEPITDMFSRFFAFLPNVLAAAILVAISWIVGRVVAGLVERLVSGVKFDALLTRMGFRAAVTDMNDLIVRTVGKLVWIVIVLLGALEALRLLNLSSVSELLLKLVLYLPTILGAILILGAGFYLAKFLAEVVAKSAEGLGDLQARFLSRACYVAVVVLAFGIALEQLAVGTEIVTAVIKIVVAGLAVAFALAVGLGAREFVAEYLKEWKKSRK